MFNFGSSTNYYHFDAKKNNNMVIQKSTSNSEGNNNTKSVEAETGMKRICNDGAYEAMTAKAKENTEKIKELAEKAKQLKLPSNPTQEEIQNFKSEIMSLREQGYALFNEVDNFKFGNGTYSFKSTEKDELYHTLENFIRILDNKLASIETAHRRANGMLSSSDVVRAMEEIQLQGTDPKSKTETETGMKKFYDDGAYEAMVEKAKENTEKIKELKEELQKVKLSSNPTQQEIENFKSQVLSLREQAYELFNEVDDFKFGKGTYRFKATEKDELYHTLEDFVKLADNKLAGIETAHRRANGMLNKSDVSRLL